MPLILPICVVTDQLEPCSASLLAFVSTSNTFVSQPGAYPDESVPINVPVAILKHAI